MNTCAKERRLFAGTNSGYGFFSLFYHIAGPEAEHIFLLKGGPGTGKSTLMDTIGKKMLLKGEEVEFFFCSSDSDSLDAIFLPSCKIAVIDATAPHVMDPVHPGAVEEIVNLADCWQEEELKKSRKRITFINREKARLFNNTYIYLSAALGFLSGLRQQYKEIKALDQKGLANIAREIASDIEAQSKKIIKNRPPVERHLFASALTPAGPVHHLQNLAGHLEQVYLLHGEMGTGKRTLLEKTYQFVRLLELDREVFHCGLDAKRIEHLILPQLNLGIFTSEEPHCLTETKATRIISTAPYHSNLPKNLQQERRELQDIYNKTIELACQNLNKAKMYHQELEEIYARQVDFSQVEKKKDYILSKIKLMLPKK